MSAGGGAPSGAGDPLPGGPLSPAERAAERFTDGEWHRLHPATPLLRGGIVFIAVLGFVLSNLRERIVNFFVGAPDLGGDPIDAIYTHGWEGWALLVVAIVLLVCLAAFYLSWRLHSFRITGDAVEVRSGILFRTQRKARLDRIQGINIVRPLLARIFGAAKLDISVAGHDANVQLAYLGSALADGLRRDVLRLASGVRAGERRAEQDGAARARGSSFGDGGSSDGSASAGAQGASAGGVGGAASPEGVASGGAFGGAASPGGVASGGAFGGAASPDGIAPSGALGGGASPGGVTASGAFGGAASPDGIAPTGPSADITSPARSSSPGGPIPGPPSRATQVGDFVTQRVNDFLAPELDPDAAPPESVVKIPPLRLFGSLLLSGFTVFLLVVVLLLVYGSAAGAPWLLIVVLPGLIGSASFYINRFTKSLRYSIAGTPDGVRVGFGLLSTSNETLPPGRIHAVEVLQPLLWRPFGWWQIRIDTAGHSKEKGAAGQPNTTMLPVGDAADVSRVLELVLPGFATEEHRAVIAAGMTSAGHDDFTGSPRRAIWLRPLSWQRTGFRMVDGAVLLRRGFVWRSLAIVPLARLQSLELQQGPLDRMLGLTEARLHTVSGPVRPRLGAIDATAGEELFETVAARAVSAAESDRSHRWGERWDEGAATRPSEVAGAPGGVPSPSDTALPPIAPLFLPPSAPFDPTPPPTTPPFAPPADIPPTSPPPPTTPPIPPTSPPPPRKDTP